MINKKNYEKSKKAIQEANPNIMALQLGAFGIDKSGNKWLYVGGYHGGWARIDSEATSINSHDTIKNLGRPIILYDVLNAIHLNRPKSENMIIFDCKSSDLIELRGTTHKGSTMGIQDIFAVTRKFWDLKNKSLDNQSDETKQFIINLKLWQTQKKSTSND